MPSVMPPARGARLERSCMASPRDWVRMAEPQDGLARMEACFAGHGYDPHRHDVYAIGLTLDGIQSFGYRGATAHSRRGQAVVLHPDETHDGRAGTEAGFRYRLAYIAPHLIQAALGNDGGPLPFVRDAVCDDVRLIAAIAPALEDLDAPLEDLQRDQIVLAVAEALAALDRSARHRRVEKSCLNAVTKAREFLDANWDRAVRSVEIEAISGLDRFALSRHFRNQYATSPYRYLVMRRLERAARLIAGGARLAEAAQCSGFADQSHMTRAFARAYGLSPGRWRRLTARSA